MANEQHVKWLLEGVEAWNARRIRAPFTPDLSDVTFQDGSEIGIFADIQKKQNKIDQSFKNANFSGANLRFSKFNLANIEQADFTNADLSHAKFYYARVVGASFVHATLAFCDFFNSNLREADFRNARFYQTDVRSANLLNALVTSLDRDNATSTATDIRGMKYLYPDQINSLIGDVKTLIHPRFKRPKHWVSDDDTESPTPETFHSKTRFTPPANFLTKDQKLQVSHFPTRPEARTASVTPVDPEQQLKTRKGLAALTKTLCAALRKYKREDREQSNRVRPAEQLLVTTEALHAALMTHEADFLPTLMQDYIDTLDHGFADDINAFEANDIALATKVIDRGRQLCALYPELVEISDPTNTRFITDDFPLNATQLEAKIKDVVFSEEGREFFDDTTRELFEAEARASVPAGQDAEKTKLARLGALVGTLRAEMSKYATRGQHAVDKAASYLKSYEKLSKIWDMIKPFIGMDS